jgi:hypothetical protein
MLSDDIISICGEAFPAVLDMAGRFGVWMMVEVKASGANAVQA